MLEDALRDLGKFIHFLMWLVPIMALVIIGLVIALVVVW